MKVWVGRIEMEIVVVAETEDEARQLVADHASDEVQNYVLASDVDYVDEVEAITDVEPEWRDSVPYGGNKTVGQYLLERGASAADDRTLPLF
jgi:hypothetical protein